MNKIGKSDWWNWLGFIAIIWVLSNLFDSGFIEEQVEEANFTMEEIKKQLASCQKEMEMRPTVTTNEVCSKDYSLWSYFWTFFIVGIILVIGYVFIRGRKA